jgi:hypothetical protein
MKLPFISPIQLCPSKTLLRVESRGFVLEHSSPYPLSLPLSFCFALEISGRGGSVPQSVWPEAEWQEGAERISWH